jgi:SAM-dependent methyltransferase
MRLTRQILQEIHAHYRGLVREYLPREGLVLKTDLYNEVKGGFRHLEGVGLDEERTVWVEYDQRACRLARVRLPGLPIVRSDIRALPFRCNSFAGVVDLSTIDHVLPEEMPRVFQEYRRVLEPGGQLILVVWTSEEEHLGPRPWDPSAQYFLPRHDLTRCLEGFENAGSDAIFVDCGFSLVGVVAEKGYEFQCRLSPGEA